MDVHRPPRPTDRPALTEVINPRNGSVRVEGDLTAAGALSLCGTVRGLVREGHQRVVLDLSGVQRADSDALGVLGGLQDALAASGGELHVIGGLGIPDAWSWI